MGQTQVKLITTLGTGKYEPTPYRFDENSEPVKTPFFPVAVVQWFHPEEVYALLTETAKGHSNWQQCKNELAKLISVENIHEQFIPDGKNEQELWQIFEVIAGVVSPGDRIMIDVTHGFRTLPMLVLLAIAYLRQVKDVQVERVLYGAFDAKGSDGVTPVFDLTPFVSLLDWLTAAKIFMTTGDGRELADLMIRVQDQAHREKADNPPKNLKKLGSRIRELSQNLLLSRVPGLAKSAQELKSELGKGELLKEIETCLPPLKPLFEQIRQKYAPFAQDDLHTQLELVRWYRDHGHLVQAYTLAREWVVNYKLREKNSWEKRMEKDTRSDIEKELSDEARKLRDGASQSTKNTVADLWDQITNYRNDIAHCGFRSDLKPAGTFKSGLNKIIEGMQSLLDKEKDTQ
ncbi:MAG: hypothetical protein KatS3mg019_1299 [Fimbriimonadales bacterium]|nr:MAG: hypothetical protein KatS3mg019_1299 [Fimbriimonadales bacterium]